jgi:hypothetical protein
MMPTNATYADGQTPQVGDVVECVNNDTCRMFFDRGEVLTVDSFFQGLLKFAYMLGAYEAGDFRLIRRADEPTEKDNADAR